MFRRAINLPSRGQADQGQAGFSLLEVIVALVIASLTLSVLFQSFGSGLRAVHQAEQTAAAALLAQSKLAAWRAGSTAERSETSGRDGPFIWSTETVPHTHHKQLNWVRTTISWPSHLPVADRQRLELTTLRRIAIKS